VVAAGFPSTKLNTVAMRGFNDDELGALCRYAWDHGFIPRFIELMPMAEGSLFYPGSFLPAQTVREILQNEFGPLAHSADTLDRPEPAPPGIGPARYSFVRYQGAARRFGLISAVTEPFCETCNRVRLSCTGELHACLAYDDATDLRSILREEVRPDGNSDSSSNGSSDSDDDALSLRLVAAIKKSLENKRPGHVFSQGGCGGPKKHMVSIGG
jgi:cyclic pyranopterin phosphate synthase